MCNYRLCVQQIGFLAKSEIQWKRPHIVSHDWLLQELKILIFEYRSKRSECTRPLKVLYNKYGTFYCCTSCMA